MIGQCIAYPLILMTGELVAGIGLLTGALTRLSAFIAILLFLNFMFAKGLWFLSPNSQDAGHRLSCAHLVALFQ